ncbi:MAG: hypothetical protein IJ802_00255, partial [Kiritimatiellae bacterium]|nr:hypothetical protein [Kiritimatiellia bacterium]
MKKESTILAVAAALLLGGCAMKEFSSTPFYTGKTVKFTAAPEERVNLWPLAYYREPVASVAWPLVSWGGDHFAVRPLYSRYGREYNVLWPLAQFDTKYGNNRILPFFWGKDRYNSLFPLYFYESPS